MKVKKRKEKLKKYKKVHCGWVRAGNQIGSALEKKNRNKRRKCSEKSRDWKFCNEKY
jgi:hypothetical protein